MQARVYSLRPKEGLLSLAALVVDGDEPLAVGLTVNGERADLERLKEEGVCDDYMTVAASLRALPQ